MNRSIKQENWSQKIAAAFFCLVVAGVVELLIAAYTQYISMDLSRFSITEYIRMDIRLRTWWSIVGIPLVSGSAYTCAGLVGLKIKAQRFVSLFFLLCFIVAMILAAIIGGSSFSTLFFTGLALAYVFPLQMARGLKPPSR